MNLTTEATVHIPYMERAIEIARSNPRHPFGAILVDSKSGAIVSEGINRSEFNPIWHGEIVAIESAGRFAERFSWQNLRLYSTAEPCPMCQSAILWSGIGHVFYGTSIPQLVEMGWRQPDLRASDVIDGWQHTSCDLTGGLLEDRCTALFAAAAINREIEIPSVMSDC